MEEDQEQEGDDFLTARSLMQRLIEYRKFKEAAQLLGRSADRQSLIFVREVALPVMTQAQADPQVQGDLDLLLEAFSRVIKFVQRREYHQVQEEEYTVEDKILMLRRRLLIESRVSLVELFEDCHAKIEMIVTVIAILELCRLKELSITQTDSFDHLYIMPRQNTSNESTLSDEAEQLAQIEANILANRTGLVDDGQLSEDEEDVLLAKLLNPDSPEEPGDGQATAPAVENMAPEAPGPELPAPEEGMDQNQAEALAEGPCEGYVISEDQVVFSDEGPCEAEAPVPGPTEPQAVPEPSAAPEPEEAPDTSVCDNTPLGGAQIIEMAWERPEVAPSDRPDGGQDEPR